MAKAKKTFSPGRIRIERQKCKGCELCIVSCPGGLLALDKTLNKRGVRPAYFAGSSEANEKGCTGCAFCALICPESCIEVYKLAG